MGLREDLLEHRPRETSGAPSANRFEYQRTWALCRLLKLHEAGQRYILILEFHDDVLVLDDDVDPQEAEFFQVKTRKDGRWSQRDLLATSKSSLKKRRKSIGVDDHEEEAGAGDAPRSILGKLLEHCRHFLLHVKTLNVVSNATFSIQLANPPESTERDNICMSELVPKALSEVKEAIKKELGIENELPWDKVYFLTSAINLTGHETYGAGELAAFLDRRYPGCPFAVQAMYRTLYAELSRRATSEWQSASFDDLCQKKGIRPGDLELWLRLGANQPDMEEQLRNIMTQLLYEDTTFRVMNEIESAWRQYDIQQIDQTNTTIQAFKEQVITVVKEVKASPNWQTLKQFLARAEGTFARLYGSPIPPFDNKYLQGAVLYELRAYETRKLPPVDSQHKAGTP